MIEVLIYQRISVYPHPGRIAVMLSRCHSIANTALSVSCRRLMMAAVAEGAFPSRSTLQCVEAGNPNVGMGIQAPGNTGLDVEILPQALPRNSASLNWPCCLQMEHEAGVEPASSAWKEGPELPDQPRSNGGLCVSLYGSPVSMQRTVACAAPPWDATGLPVLGTEPERNLA